MTGTLDAGAILDREFLGLRARLLEVGAVLDRLDRAEGGVADDPRMEKIRRTLVILADETNSGTRAEKIQLLFSREYDERWRTTLGVVEQQGR